MGVVVELQIIHPDHCVVIHHGLRAAQNGTDPGHHLIQAERFGDIVVSAHGQAGHFVFGVVLGREEQHGEPLAGSAEPPGHGEAVHIGQHDVQDGEVRCMELGRGKSFTSAAGRDNFEAGKPKRGGEQLTDVRFIIHDEELGFRAVLFHNSHDAPRIWKFSGRLMCVR
ncbi:hypothetical protein AHiyo6_14380 [Arthrobacter sp. Hiyo6]|nr:hypothetical protein AHiyo6_14380 [Arthrobacter sp. Hiyo6]